MRILITGTVAILIILGLVKTIQDYEMTNDTSRQLSTTKMMIKSSILIILKIYMRKNLTHLISFKSPKNCKSRSHLSFTFHSYIL